MTPRRRRLTPSPPLLTAPQNRPSPTRSTPPLWPKTPLYKRTCQDGTPLPSCTHTHTSRPSIAPGGTLLRTVDPQKTALFLPLCLILLSPRSILSRTDDTMRRFTRGWALTYCRRPPLAHVWLARSVGLIASKVNKIGDKNQFQKRPGTQEAALR